MVFLVVMYGCESWTIKKAECWRIDALGLWCWRRLLRVPWTSRRSNQSILKEIRPECSLERLMLKLKLQYFGRLMQRTDSFEKTLMLGKIEGGRRRGQQRMRWLDSVTDSTNMSLSKSKGWWWTGKPGVLQFTGSQRFGHDWATELNWTECYSQVIYSEVTQRNSSFCIEIYWKVICMAEIEKDYDLSVITLIYSDTFIYIWFFLAETNRQISNKFIYTFKYFCLSVLMMPITRKWCLRLWFFRTKVFPWII